MTTPDQAANDDLLPTLVMMKEARTMLAALKRLQNLLEACDGPHIEAKELLRRTIAKAEGRHD